MGVPKVSVIMITYGHEAYIGQAIEGVLMQQCSFDFELIIANDCSPDKTDEVVKNYIATHPKGHCIKYFNHDQNIGMMPNFVFALNKVQGSLLALCEGDDFWIDPLKLQKQADFLDANNDYGLVHTDCNFLYSNGETRNNVNKKNRLNLVNHHSNDTIFDALINGSYKIRTATVVLKKSLYDSVYPDIQQLQGRFLMGDTPMWLLMSQKLKFHYIDEVSTVYRISKNSTSRPKHIQQKMRFKLSMFEMRLYFLNKFNKPVTQHIKRKYNNALLNYKIYNSEYKEEYPLITPTTFQSFINKNINSDFVKMIWKFKLAKDKMLNLINS